MAELVDRVSALLQGAGYEVLPSTFAVAGVKFTFSAMLRGKRARGSDLIVVVDTSMITDATGARTRSKVEALSRALDVAGSRLVLTTVLCGPPLSPSEVEQLARSSRVLVIEMTEEGRDPPLDDLLRVLMPLDLGAQTELGVNPVDELRSRLVGAVPAEITEPILAASARGRGAVTHHLKALLDEALDASEDS